MTDHGGDERQPLRGQWALVTGGSKGIGRACVTGLAAAGAHVLFTHRGTDPQAAEDLVAAVAGQGGEAVALVADGSHAETYLDLAARVAGLSGGRLNILVNNVGDALRRSSFQASDDTLWNDCLTLNLMSAVRACRAMLPLLEAAGSAVVVNMSSIAGTTSGAPDSLHYGVAKAALDTFTKGLAKEWGGLGIRVVGVAPSAIDTDFQVRHSSAERLGKVVAQTPAGRIGTAEEVAAVVCALCLPGFSYVSGATVPVTGGR